MSDIPARTQVAIIGGGPAGSLLAHLLHNEGIDVVVLEMRSREYVLGRVRAGVIEHGTASLLREVGLGARLDAEGFVHHGVNLAFAGSVTRLDFEALTGKHVVIYGQTELQKDLYNALDRQGVALIDEVSEVRIDLGEEPSVSFDRDGSSHAINADFIIGCDGAHGVSRGYIPSSVHYEKVYPFVWVGVLSPTRPISEELVYVNHDDGFALCSMRNQNLSRYYVQGEAGDTIDDWPDDRFWETLATRLLPELASDLVTGDSIEKLVTPLRSWAAEPMSHGRLFVAGDAAHVVPPTGAKGLNLAISDVIYLHEALHHFYSSGSTTGLDTYSDRALARVWKAMRFSWWMTRTLHRFPGDDFDRRIQLTELEYIAGSESAQRSLAENYVGLPF